MKKLKHLVVSATVAEKKMDEFAAPVKNFATIPAKSAKPWPLLGKIVRIVDDSSHLCGHLIDVKSHEGSKVMGQPVFKTYLKDFIPQAEKAPHQIVCDEKAVVDLTEIEKLEAKVCKHMKFTQEERADMEMLFDPEELQ